MSGLQVPENFSGKKESVTSVSLDDWIKSNGIISVDLIKLDIEGAEKKALEKMNFILQEHRPVVFIEIIASHLARFNCSVQDVYSIFSGSGYQAYEIIKQNKLKPIKDAEEGYDIVFIPEEYQLPNNIKIVNCYA
jgi:antitoxin component HigA of HigAB toxin-antitoxin module